MKKRLLSLLVIVIFLAPNITKAQNSVEDYLRTLITSAYGEEYMKGYMQPFANTLGLSMGSAIYHRGYSKTLPRFDVGVSAVYIPIPDADKTFTSPYSAVQGDVPTVFGSSDPNINGAIPGINSDAFLLPMLQANIGLFSNFEATGRFITTDIDQVGKLTIYGGALKYELSGLIPIPLFPIDFGVQAGYHKFMLGDIIDAGTFSMNFQASASIPLFPVDVYGGIGFDNSSMTIKSAEIVPGTTLGDITIDADSKVHFNVGASFTLLFFNVHVDYNIGKYKYFGAGAMFVL